MRRSGGTLYYALLQVPVLITPLSDDAEGVLEEGDDDEETPNCREMGAEGLGVNVDPVFYFGRVCPDFLNWIVWVCRALLVAWCASAEAVGVISVGRGCGEAVL